MSLNKIHCVQPKLKIIFNLRQNFSSFVQMMQSATLQEATSKVDTAKVATAKVYSDSANVTSEIYPATRAVPMILTKSSPEVLPFDQVPGPKALKYFSNLRQYSFQIGTQLTAGFLTIALNISSYFGTKNPLAVVPRLFDEYGPVVRFVSPVGADIVFINHPEHIQKVFTMEGEYPVRSALDSLDRYRTERRHNLMGLYSMQGQEWARNRSIVCSPLHTTVSQNILSLKNICDTFTQKISNMRNHQDEVHGDLLKEIHKWSYDCMGLILFAKKFSMLETDVIYSQDDVSWLYNSLDKATEAIVKCESGFHMWKLVPTLAWYSLVKHCDIMDGLIGKYIMQAKDSIGQDVGDDSFDKGMDSVVAAMLENQQQLNMEDMSTMLMDMLLIGVNTITSSTSFLLYYLAKYQKTQNVLVQEMDAIVTSDMTSVQRLKDSTPYLQACIKEALRLVPPIPMVSRILPKNIILDKYNIPRGTLIIIANQNACLKESNFDDAEKFCPERWLPEDSRDFHAFASIPFGYGARRCLGQNLAETMISLLTIQILKKFKLEYHYGDIKPTKKFICKPNKPLKIRFVERNDQ